MSRNSFLVASTTPVSTHNQETRAVGRKRKLSILASPDPAVATLVDTPSVRSDVRQKPESIDDDDNAVPPRQKASQQDLSHHGSDTSTDSAEFSDEDASPALIPSDRIALALERIARLLEPLQPTGVAKRRATRSLVDTYLDEVWNVVTGSLNVEHTLDRYELHVLNRVASHVTRIVLPDAAALRLDGEAIVRQAYVSTTKKGECVACATTKASNKLCEPCMRGIALVRQIISLLVMRNTMNSKDEVGAVTKALADLDSQRNEWLLRVKRDL